MMANRDNAGIKTDFVDKFIAALDTVKIARVEGLFFHWLAFQFHVACQPRTHSPGRNPYKTRSYLRSPGSCSPAEN